MQEIREVIERIDNEELKRKLLSVLEGKDNPMREMCNRCGHTWMKRSEATPKNCPKCKSPYWNKERKHKRQFTRPAIIIVSPNQELPNTSTTHNSVTLSYNLPNNNDKNESEDTK